MPDATVSLVGQFGLSAPDVLALRQCEGVGPCMQALVCGVEDELVQWLQEVVVVVRDPGTVEPAGWSVSVPGSCSCRVKDICEVECNPLQLVWWTENDTWVWYVVHQCVQYHNSCDTSQVRTP